jgi:hypothetical protein
MAGWLLKVGEPSSVPLTSPHHNHPRYRKMDAPITPDAENATETLDVEIFKVS